MKSKQEEPEKTMGSPKARCFVMTVKNWNYFDTQEWEEAILNQKNNKEEPLVIYLSIGKHTGEKTGYQHVHMNLELTDQKTCFWVKNKLFVRPDMHVEIRRGTREQADRYLTKDHQFREIVNLRRLQQGRRTDLEHIKELIDEGSSFFDLYSENFSATVRYEKGLRNYIAMRDTIEATSTIFPAPDVIVYVGPSGSGKSWRCSTDKDYVDGKGYRFPIQMDSKIYFDGYDRQKCLWFDEFSGKCMQFTKFCQLTDRYGGRYETKGGSVLIYGLKKILISTIQFPHLWWAGSERFLTDTEQLFRRLTKCYYLGAPRITADGRKQYAKPLEFNPRECGTGDFEAILRQHVEYEDPVEEVDPDATEEEDSEATVDESD